MRVIDPRTRLPELAAQRRTTLTDLSRIIGERPRYLHRFVKDGVPAQLDDSAFETLSRFFGLPAFELGGPYQRRAGRVAS